MSRPIKIGSWGGSGGEPRDLDGSLPHPTRLASVTVTSSRDVVHSIQFTFVDSEKKTREEPTWGVTGGEKRETISLRPFEHIVHVSGTVGQWSDVESVITSLKFVTNKAQKYNFGQPRGDAFAFDIPLEEGGGQILGFFGRSGIVLDAIGFYIGHTHTE